MGGQRGEKSCLEFCFDFSAMIFLSLKKTVGYEHEHTFGCIDRDRENDNDRQTGKQKHNSTNK
jgi:hypothetical protein